MKKLKNTLISIILAFCMLLPLAACGGNNTESKVESVELERSALTLNVGESATLGYIVFPEGASTEGAKWFSSDPTVATVEGGVVTAVKDGKAAIRITIGEIHADCTVTVIDPAKLPVAATGVTLSQKNLSLDVGGTAQLTATVEPANAADKTVTFSSSNTSVAKVSGTGLVTAVGGGSAVITAQTANNYNDTCIVQVSGEVAGPALYVAQVTSLAGREAGSEHPFIMAMDSSELLSVEAARRENGLTFKDFDGKEADVLQVLKDNGITDIRIRVWNDPYADAAKQQGYGAGNCDVENAVKLSERCAAVGLGVIIDFHYSDFWADPAKQKAPKDWEIYANNIDGKVTALKKFTKDALEEIKGTNVKITMVQVGNETTGGMAGETDWTKICKLMNAGAEAVREVTGTVANGGAKVAVHFTNAGSNNFMEKARTLSDNHVDYDVFGSSWYPYYTSAGSLSGLISQFKDVNERYHKEVMVLETGYAWTRDDFDGCGNTALEETTQPLTVQGMSNSVREVIEAVANLGDYGLGVSYWGGTWVAASMSTDGNTNRALCLEHGCGWATSYAHNYDESAPSPVGTAKTPTSGGTMVDNNAFFRSDGSPIEALKVFKYVWEAGHTSDLYADYLEEQELYYEVGRGTIELPKTVNVVLNNGSAMEIDAVWAIEKTELEEYINKVGMYDVEGTTNFGGTCICHVWVTNVNLLTGGSFEEEQGIEKAYGSQNGGAIYLSNMGDWAATFNNSGSGNLQLYVSNESQNARMGTNSFHFWDSDKVDFKLFQMVDMSKITENGKYTCSFELQGDQGEKIDIHAYITVTYKDGSKQTFEGSKLTQLDGWTHWQRTQASVTIEDIANVTSIEVGISVYSDPVGEGPWGNIDNCQFYFEG